MFQEHRVAYTSSLALQLFAVQKSKERQFSFHCRHSYASVAFRSPLYPDLLTALMVVSLMSTCLVWLDQTAARPHPLQLLLPDCVRFSCCSSNVSACYHTHTVQSIIQHISKFLQHLVATASTLSANRRTEFKCNLIVLLSED